MRTDPVSLSYRRDPLLGVIERFLVESGLSATAFGVLAMKDPRFVHEMRAGREVRRATRLRVAACIRAARARAGGNRPVCPTEAGGRDEAIEI
ncbi:hypothetical protein [Gluconacetobacter takamatsuzukensis]|uniref:Uncharacterized protein n=1 Tax=Gluconacetobacter takamatsuzukensis TaxID=1286190 RepID=A0A7W4KET6_9PROT|nr:hypothetical protein [Gluconacetobacter takamatsuzukensis]MBB2205593.1 hypothetical protein [Gluconacetobacter takamatsuzukensis]